MRGKRKGQKSAENGTKRRRKKVWSESDEVHKNERWRKWDRDSRLVNGSLRSKSKRLKVV